MREELFTPHIRACVALHNIMINHSEAFDERLLVHAAGGDSDDDANGADDDGEGPAAAGGVVGGGAAVGEIVRNAIAMKLVEGNGRWV
jgi:hypothetical protein